jgi:hypothetical protein
LKGDSEASADHGFLVYSGRKSEPRSEIVPVIFHIQASRPAVLARKYQFLFGEVERGDAVVLLDERAEILPAESGIQSQPAINAPVILKIGRFPCKRNPGE